MVPSRALAPGRRRRPGGGEEKTIRGGRGGGGEGGGGRASLEAEQKRNFHLRLSVDKTVGENKAARHLE